MHEQARFLSSTGFVMTRGKALLFVFPVLLAFLFRFPLLAQRPMHCDEAVHADKFGTLLEQGRYEYSTVDYHGPTLYYMALVRVRIALRP
jgi:predicted membrane-bound mannosyltransferase